MKITPTQEWLPVYEALASKVRLNIIQLLSEKPRNIKELAHELSLSSAIMTMHVKKLEAAGIVQSEKLVRDGAAQKLCSLVMDLLEIKFPLSAKDKTCYHEFNLPVGHYTDFDAAPTCGLATTKKTIGQFDDPRFFLDEERVNAKILWFTEGYVEYKVPNYLMISQQPEQLSISMELGSEAPGYNNNWPSDISFFLNGVYLGQWTSPGDFGDKPGKFTPPWWEGYLNQYGLLKILQIDSRGTFIDGEKISDITLEDLDIRQKQWTFRISVLPESKHVGGLTLFGKGFGNYDQDIIFRLYYRDLDRRA